MLLTDLSDDVLLSNLTTLCGNERKLLARVIAYLAEVDERRLHLKVASSSLFDFCVSHLDMSEGEAFRRIAASRLIRRFPSLLGRIERGEIHLSGLLLLRDHLTQENHEELVSAASRKTKRKVQELIATRFPRPDVPSTIRQLPTAASSAASGNATPPATPPASQTSLAIMTTTVGLASPEAPACAATPPTAPQYTAPQHSPKASSSRAAARIEPLSAARFKVQFTASTELCGKIERARELMRHRNPGGDLEVVVERAVDLLIANLEKERLGKTTRAQKNPRAAKASHVTRAARRAVFERDGEQCSYVDEATGQRCPSRSFLEIDHIHPRALGGSSDVANLRVRCRNHNLLSAEDVFGRERIAQQVHLRQRKRDSRRQAHVSTPTPTPTPRHATTPSATADPASTELLGVTTSALVNLGFRESEARRALGVVMTRLEPATLSSMPIQSILREALAVLT